MEEYTVSSPVLPLTGTALSRNPRIPVSGDNPSLRVQAASNGSTPFAVSQRCIATLLRRIATPKVAPSHDTNYCIATHPIARPPARSARPCAQAGHVVALAGCVVGLCRRVACRIVAPCCTPLRPVSRYNLLYCDSN